MRILVTGGAGFQGSHLAEKWSGDEHHVTVLNTYSVEAEENISGFADDVSIVWGTVTDPEIVEKTVRGQDVVVHLAARINVDESIDEPGKFVEVNVRGTANVLEAVRRSGARMILASSCEVYGFASGYLVTESAEMRPHSPYAASKAGADRLAFAYHKSYGLDVTMIRPCNIYGGRQKSGRGGAVIPIFVQRAISGMPMTLFGSGDQRREYMHVKDLVAAYDLVLKSSDLGGAALNVGSGEMPSIKEIAEFVTEKTAASIISGPARPGEVEGFTLDSTRINKLGFSPKIGFWDGLASYIEETRRVTPVSAKR